VQNSTTGQKYDSVGQHMGKLVNGYFYFCWTQEFNDSFQCGGRFIHATGDKNDGIHQQL